MPVALSPQRHRMSEMLLDIKAVHCNPEKPFIFTSGWASPVYVNCRWLISETEQRGATVRLMAEQIESALDGRAIACVAGGETAGIPFAAWIADRLDLPMVYVRKKKKGFGLDSQIEGGSVEGLDVLIVEDLMTDGMSKVHFVNALRAAGARVTDAAVVFNYGVYPSTEKNLADARLRVHALTDWRTTLEVASARGDFSPAEVSVVRAFLDDPSGWSIAHGGVGE